MKNPPPEQHFDFHSCRVAFSCEERSTSAGIASDFSRFASAPGTGIRIGAELREVRRRDLPRSMFRTRAWSVLRSPSGIRSVWYPEGALAEYDYASRRGTVTSADPDLLRELSYLLILSRAGEALDRLGVHRLHAGALGFREKALVFCGSRGTGKTTLLLELLKYPSFSLLSDDTPLVRADGTVLPFPVRIGLGLDSPHIGRFQGLTPLRRRRCAPKRLLEIGKGGFSVAGPLSAGAVFLLRRASVPGISPADPAAAFRELAVSLAAGYGVPQLAEFFLRPQLSDIARKAAILKSRLGAAAALYRKASFHIFRVSPDPARNARALRTFLNSGSAWDARR